MKKIFAATILVLMIAMLIVGSASAQKDSVNIKGEVAAIGSGTLTIKSNKGETYVVTVPDSIDVSTIVVGDSVLVKASTGEDDALLAVSIKQVGGGSENSNGKDKKEKPEGFKDNSAFCAEGKQEKPHPLAPKIAERYDVSEEMITGYFCDGYSIGAIMLAIKTSQLEGITADPGKMLENRAAGNAWGQIWKGLGLIGSEKDGYSPPGLLKRPEQAGPKNKE